MTGDFAPVQGGGLGMEQGRLFGGGGGNSDQAVWYGPKLNFGQFH